MNNPMKAGAARHLKPVERAMYESAYKAGNKKLVDMYEKKIYAGLAKEKEDKMVEAERYAELAGRDVRDSTNYVSAYGDQQSWKGNIPFYGTLSGNSPALAYSDFREAIVGRPERTEEFVNETNRLKELSKSSDKQQAEAAKKQLATRQTAKAEEARGQAVGNIMSGALNAIEPVTDIAGLIPTVRTGLMVAKPALGRAIINTLRDPANSWENFLYKKVSDLTDTDKANLAKRATNAGISEYDIISPPDRGENLNTLQYLVDANPKYYANFVTGRNLSRPAAASINYLSGKQSLRQATGIDNKLNYINRSFNRLKDDINAVVAANPDKRLAVALDKFDFLVKKYPNIKPEEIQKAINTALESKGYPIVTTVKPINKGFDIYTYDKNLVEQKGYGPSSKLGSINLKPQYYRQTGIKSLDDAIKTTYTATNDRQYFGNQGLRKASDYPGVENYYMAAGTMHNAINDLLKKKKLGNLLSGGTGHSSDGLERWEKLVQKGLAEYIYKDPKNSNKNIYRLLKKGGKL